jgi:hypothetical protein
LSISSLFSRASNFSKSIFPLNGAGVKRSNPSLQSKSTGVARAASKLALVVSKWLLLGIMSPSLTVIVARIFSLALPW